MASYKYIKYLGQSTSDTFDQITHPSEQTPYSGIYRCEGCGREISSVHPHTMPPQNHHQHSTTQGAIRWRLIVWADHNPK